MKRLISYIAIDEVNYPIVTDCIEIIEIIDMSKIDPLSAILKFYNGVLPHNAEIAFTEFSRFIGGYNERPTPNSKGKKTIDYSFDIDLIYTAILKEYHINIYKDGVHWFEFLWMLADLKQPSLLQDVITSRSGNLPREQVQAYSRLKKLYPLVD